LRCETFSDLILFYHNYRNRCQGVSQKQKGRSLGMLQKLLHKRNVGEDTKEAL